MARAIWSGSVSFGLVSIPVKMYSATESKDVRFHQFEEGSGERIRYQRVAEESGHEVDYEDIVKGYEVHKGEFVIVTPEELEAADPEKTHTIEIEDFVDLVDIDPIYYEKTYYLAPPKESGAEKSYGLLRRAMEDAGKVGIAKFVMRSKEYLAAVRPMDDLLALETMYFADEVRGVDEVENVPARSRVGDRELKTAKQLIDSLSTDWDPKRYHDTYRERVLEIVKQKAEGKDIVAPEKAEQPKVKDLLEALRASVEATKKGQRPKDAMAASDSNGKSGRGKAKRSSRASAQPDFEEWSKDDLYEKAGELDIGGRSKMSKDDLVKALRKAS
jgi:DNA end-binding protein Ku